MRSISYPAGSLFRMDLTYFDDCVGKDMTLHHEAIVRYRDAVVMTEGLPRRMDDLVCPGPNGAPKYKNWWWDSNVFVPCKPLLPHRVCRNLCSEANFLVGTIVFVGAGAVHCGDRQLTAPSPRLLKSIEPLTTWSWKHEAISSESSKSIAPTTRHNHRNHSFKVGDLFVLDADRPEVASALFDRCFLTAP